MTPAERVQEFKELSETFWHSVGDATPIIEFFQKLSKESIYDQQEFFIAIADIYEVPCTERNAVEVGISYALDFYPRLDTGSFPDFEHLYEHT